MQTGSRSIVNKLKARALLDCVQKHKVLVQLSDSCQIPVQR